MQANTIEEKTGIFLITLPAAEGYYTQEYYGLVSGSCVVGANFVKDYFASLHDKFGGRASAYEKEIQKAITTALYNMALEAKERGANAVVGIDIDTSVVGDSMFMATCYGTAIGMDQKPVPKSASEP